MSNGSYDSPRLWDDVVRRSRVDRDFRQRLLSRTTDALAEMGIDVGQTSVVVREFRANERLLILPPVIDEEQAPLRPRDARPLAGPPSPPMRGIAACALLDPDDDRVYYGS